MPRLTRAFRGNLSCARSLCRFGMQSGYSLFAFIFKLLLSAVIQQVGFTLLTYEHYAVSEVTRTSPRIAVDWADRDYFLSIFRLDSLPGKKREAARLACAHGLLQGNHGSLYSTLELPRCQAGFGTNEMSYKRRCPDYRWRLSDGSLTRFD